jgi:hypothetical protein
MKAGLLRDRKRRPTYLNALHFLNCQFITLYCIPINDTYQYLINQTMNSYQSLNSQ